MFLLFPYVWMIFSCVSRSEIKGFDKELWQSDEKGCLGKRIIIADSILSNKKKWKGLDDDIVINLLGTPEKKFYYERNAKAFLYYIEPGNQCVENHSNKSGRKLIAEINATGFVNIIRTEP